MPVSSGLHHVTAIAGDARRNVAFYRDLLGLALVKKTVNFDDPSTYHLYFGNAEATPGSILTFFPWEHAAPGRIGTGQATETAFAIPRAALSFWLDRLALLSVPHEVPVQHFGNSVVRFADPDGMPLALVAGDGAAAERASHADVPAEVAITGFAGVTLETRSGLTAHIVEHVFGFQPTAKDGDMVRFTAQGGTGTTVDVRTVGTPSAGRMGRGSVHHVAFRAQDDAQQQDMVTSLRQMGLQVTDQVDRNYFRSVYVREPGGILFEIATDAPGFAIDEPADKLGQTLMLPPWLEARRAALEASLPAIP
jgi:glyoxalase family protein